MRAVVVAIGSELLQGFLVDTNSAFLAQELATLGIDVVGIHGVGDHQPSIVTTLRRALQDADIIVCTGGIGPTSDDLSREAVAEVCHETPEVDPVVLKTVRSFFIRRGSIMPERNAKQAWTIPSAQVLANPMGTAPGWFVQKDNKAIVLMPGVPREMMPMWQGEVIPRILPMLDSDVIVSQTLKTIGIGESSVEEQLRELIDRGNPAVSTYAKNDGVHVRIFATGDDESTVRNDVQQVESEVRSILGNSVYGTLDVTLPAAVLKPLAQLGERLAIVELGTAGQVTSLLMSDPDVSHCIAEARAYSRETARLAACQEDLRSRVLETMQTCEAGHGLGVSVVTSDKDEMGRFDASIDVFVHTSDNEQISTYTFAAREIELGRRASLLAAEALRNALLDSTTRHQG